MSSLAVNIHNNLIEWQSALSKVLPKPTGQPVGISFEQVQAVSLQMQTALEQGATAFYQSELPVQVAYELQSLITEAQQALNVLNKLGCDYPQPNYPVTNANMAVAVANEIQRLACAWCETVHSGA